MDLKSLPEIFTQITLRKRPSGAFDPSSDVAINTSTPLPNPQTIPLHHALLRILYVSADPAMRGWMSDMKSYLPPIPIGGVIRSQAVAQILFISESPDQLMPSTSTSTGTSISDNNKNNNSNNSNNNYNNKISTTAPIKPRQFKVGDVVTGMFGWTEYAVVPVWHISPLPRSIAAVPSSPKISYALGVYGTTGLTAYFGLLRIGRPKPGETVVVSAAAGATGSVVAQIAKHVFGCHVVCLAGGHDKCQKVKKDLGCDNVVDYKKYDTVRKMTGALHVACPKGIDVYFDNVGGIILDASLRLLNDFGRVVLCGAISTYNEKFMKPGPSAYVNLISRRGIMQGFIVLDHKKEYGLAVYDLEKWVEEGKIKVEETLVEGLKNAPDALNMLFQGKNQGKVVIRVNEPLARPLKLARL